MFNCLVFQSHTSYRDEIGFGDPFHMVYVASTPTGYALNNCDADNNNPGEVKLTMRTFLTDLDGDGHWGSDK